MDLRQVLDDDLSYSEVDQVSYSALIGPSLHITGIDVNTDATKILVGGRQILKVMKMESDHFSDVCNLHTREMTKLSYSVTDVAWSHAEENMVASAATNGDVITWDLNKVGRNKQDHLYKYHQRTCNRISFHSTEPHILLTGCQDGTVILIDVRSKSIGLMFGQDVNAPIRDVQLSPHQATCFATACEDGSIKLWDTRMTNRCQLCFNAHYGPAFCVDWHPDERWLATGGRDKMIRVYDTAQEKGLIDLPIHTVQTVAAASRIKWRPKRRYQLASCSQLLDFNLQIWDIRRPFVPIAAFPAHKDVMTGIAWKGNDPHCVLTCGRDGYVFLHSFRDAGRPLRHISPIAINISPAGCLGHAFAKSASECPPTIVEESSRPERVTKPSLILSHLSVYDPENTLSCLSMESFVELARNYRLTGEPASRLCEYNAGVASRLKCSEVAQTWRMLQFMCLAVLPSPPTVVAVLPTVAIATNLPPPVTALVEPAGILARVSAVETVSIVETLPTVVAETQKDAQTIEGSSMAVDRKLADVVTDIVNEDDRSFTIVEDEPTGFVLDSRRFALDRSPAAGGPTAALARAIARCDSLTDVLFDAEYLSVAFNSSDDVIDRDKDQWQLPSEPLGSFYPGDESDFVIVNTPADSEDETEAEVPALVPFAHKWLGAFKSQPTFGGEWLTELQTRSRFSDDWAGDRRDSVTDDVPPIQPDISRIVEVTESAIKQEILNTSPYGATVSPALDFTKVIVDVIEQYASQNDVQMAVCILLCLGDKFIRMFDERHLEQWFMSYIDLLHTFELWSIAADVIKLSVAVPEVHAMSCISTRIITSCSNCLRMHNRAGWLCERCSNYIHKCCICHLPVKGLYIWCQACAHGGHLEHLTDWFSKHKLCPTGCGHKCEYA